MPAKIPLDRPFFFVTPADMQSSFDTKVCRVLDFESGTREGGSGYDILHLSIGKSSLRRKVDQELSAKIESELQLEREMRDSEKLPSSLQDYLDSSSFEVSLRNLAVLRPVLRSHSSMTPPAKKRSF